MKKWYSILLFVINVIFYFVLIALWISIPDELILNLSLTVFNLSLTSIIIYLNRDRASLYYQSHQFKKLVDTLVFLFLIFSLLGIVNYWAFKHPRQIDLSAYKMNSLSDQSKNILKKIKGDVTFKLFARKQDSALWLPLFEYYRAEKNTISIEKVDIDVRPDLVADYHITDAATLVIEYEGKRQYVTERDELNITNGLIKISRTSDPVVYFIQGHGEADIQSTENEGLKFIYEAIRNSAVDIRPLNLLSTQEIPFDAKTIILWGPKSKLQTNELKVLERFLARKGNLLLALDPDLNQDIHGELRSLLRTYRIIVRNDLVIDRKSFVNGSDGSIPLVESYNKEHAITKKFKGQVFFPLVSSIEEIPSALSKEKGEVSLLMSSSALPEAWGETSIKEVAQQKLIYQKGIDQPGPLSFSAAYESEQNKLVVFGNSTFVLNAYLKFGTNYSLFLNSLSWLVDEDRLISFNLPIVQNEPVFISEQQMGIVFYFSVLFSPLILFGVSIYMYRRKRDK
ncbi:MAG: Gldg family protein [Bacteriovorax sp.]|nr:Gldg family protein [Bacteriovorax sp.]